MTDTNQDKEPTVLSFYGREFTTVMTKAELKLILDKNNVPVDVGTKANVIMRECGCECHDPNLAVRHIAPCCQLTYTKLFTNLVNSQ